MTKLPSAFFTLFLLLLLVSAHNVPDENLYPLGGLCLQDNTYLFSAPRTDSEYELAGYLTPVSVEDMVSGGGFDWYLVKYKNNLYYTFTNCVETDRNKFLSLSNFQACIQNRTFLIRSLSTGLVYYKEPIRLPIQYMELYSDLKVFQKSMGNYLEVSVGGVDVTGFLYGLYDTHDRKWRLRFDNRANQNVIALSPDGKYAAVDSGTGASIRNLDVFNLSTGKREFTSDYNAAVRPLWKTNMLIFFRNYGRYARGLPALDKTSQRVYAQKCVFANGTSSALDFYTNVFTE